MRKRDRERLAKQLRTKLDKLHELVCGQLDAAIWYAEADAEGKAYSWAYAAADNAKLLGDELFNFLQVKAK